MIVLGTIHACGGDLYRLLFYLVVKLLFSYINIPIPAMCCRLPREAQNINISLRPISALQRFTSIQAT